MFGKAPQFDVIGLFGGNTLSSENSPAATTEISTENTPLNPKKGANYGTVSGLSSHSVIFGVRRSNSQESLKKANTAPDGICTKTEYTHTK